MKATLLSLPISSDGVLDEWRERLVELTGLPLRTVDRHLARALDAGWLVHEVHGGRNHRARYVVAVPGDGSARHTWQAETGFCLPRSTDRDAFSVCHVVAESERDTASVASDLAVDAERHGEMTTDFDRVSRESRSPQERADEQAAGTSSPSAAVSPGDAGQTGDGTSRSSLSQHRSAS